MNNIQFWSETLRLLVELAATVAFALRFAGVSPLALNL